MTRVNEIIFADLIIPGVNNGSPYFSVLVVIDGYSRYVKVFMLKSKTEGEVNEHLKHYIKWAERQRAHELDPNVQQKIWCDKS